MMNSFGNNGQQKEIFESRKTLFVMFHVSNAPDDEIERQTVLFHYPMELALKALLVMLGEDNDIDFALGTV